MKNIKFFLVLILFIAGNAVVVAQHNHGGGGSAANMNMKMNQISKIPIPTRTDNLKVWGKCNMCKERIEKIAIACGSESAYWDVKTKSLRVVYSPGSSSLQYISDKLAKAGHDTGQRSAKEKAYNSLPECCKYERIR